MFAKVAKSLKKVSNNTATTTLDFELQFDVKKSLFLSQVLGNESETLEDEIKIFQKA